MSTLPAADIYSSLTTTEAVADAGLDAMRQVIAELPGGGTETTLTIAAGVIAPGVGAARIVSIEGESAAADDLTNIDCTQCPDGAVFFLRCANASHVITVKHAAGGAGQFACLSSEDMILDATTTWAVCKRTGTSVEILGRLGVAVDRGVTAKAASYTVKTQDHGKTFSNEGASAIVVFTLPAAAAGLEYGAIVQDTDGIRLQAVGDDTIRVAGVGVSAAAGKLESTTQGGAVRLKAINATEWVAVAVVGTWTPT